jgi:hypothetical protein
LLFDTGLMFTWLPNARSTEYLLECQPIWVEFYCDCRTLMMVMIGRVVKVIAFMLLAVENLRCSQLRFAFLSSLNCQLTFLF